MSKRRAVVMKALEKLSAASPSRIFTVAVQIDSSITLRDVNFELYHGSRDPENPLYKKIGRGKYTLLRKS